MRERDKQALWAEMVNRLGKDAHTEEEWADFYSRFLRSWDGGRGVILLKEGDLYDAIWERQPPSVELRWKHRKRFHSENVKESPKRNNQRPHGLVVSKSNGALTTFPLNRQPLQRSEEFQESLPLAICRKQMDTEVSSRVRSYALPPAPILKRKRGRLSLCQSQLQLEKAQERINKRIYTEKYVREVQKLREAELLGKKNENVEEEVALPSFSVRTSTESAVKVVRSILEYSPPNEFLLLPQIGDVQTAHMSPTAINLSPTKAQIKEPILKTPSIAEKNGEILSIIEKNREIISVNHDVGQPKLAIQSICNSISFDHNYNMTLNGNIEVQSTKKYNGYISNDVEVEEQLVDDALEMTNPVMDVCKIFQDDVTGEIDILNFSDGADDQLDIQVVEAENDIELCIQDYDMETPVEINHHLECFDELQMTPPQLKDEANDKIFNSTNGVNQLAEDKTPLELEVAENNNLDYDYDDDDDDDDDDVLSVAASCYEFEKDMDEGMELQDKAKDAQSERVDSVNGSNLNQLCTRNFSSRELKQQPEIMQSLYTATDRKPRKRVSRFSAMPTQADSSAISSEMGPAMGSLTTPADVSEQRAQALAGRRPSVGLPLFAPPYRLPPNSDENMNIASVSTLFNDYKYELFGIKCWNNLDNSCPKLDCNHQFHSVGEVVSRLIRLEKSQLISSYFDVIGSSKLFQQYFSCYADVFANRRLLRCLTQMVSDCRLYRQLSAPFLSYIYTVLQQCGEERNGVTCMMSDLWLPSKANQFKELTVIMLKILASGNWSDYMAELKDLFKNYRFPMPNDFMTEIVQAAIKKKELLQSALQLVLLRRIDGVHDEPLIRVLNMIALSGNSPPLGPKSYQSTVAFKHQHLYRHPPPIGLSQLNHTDQSESRKSVVDLSTQNGVAPSYTPVNSNQFTINNAINKF